MNLLGLNAEEHKHFRSDVFGVLGTPGSVTNNDLSADRTDKYQTGVRFRI